MYLTLSTLIQAIIIFGFVGAVGGLLSGFSMSTREPDDETSGVLAIVGAIVAGICALVLVFAPLSGVGYECGGVVLDLSLYLAFLGIGLTINPKGF
jgi:hypothetical protein